MSSAIDRSPQDRSLQISHRTVLAMIAICAVISAIQPSDSEEPSPDPTVTTIAVGLALATIVLRRGSTSPVVAARTRLTLILSAYACAFALALLGAFVAIRDGQSQTGLIFALAAGIFCLRPPPRIRAED